MSMHFSFNDGRAPRSGDGAPRGDRPDSERAFRILVIADFSGRESRGVLDPLTDRKPVRVDLDRLDDLPGELGARVRLPQRGGVEIGLSCIDDLHPDEIYDACEVFAALRDLRKQARDPDAFRAVSEKVRAWAAGPARPASEIETKPSTVATPESEFASLLAGSVGKQPSRAVSSIETLLKQIVGPHIVP